MKILRYIFVVFLFAGHVGISWGQEYAETGISSYYTDKWQGRLTASGERYDKNLLTAAHRSLAFNTLVKVTNVKNDKSVIVRIIDRGPYIHDRILDLSGAAARELGFYTTGVTEVKAEYVGMANKDSIAAFLSSRADFIEKAELSKEPAPVVKAEVKTQKPAPSKAAFYDQAQKLCSPKGFGVQVGTYSNFSSCRNAMNNFASVYGARAFMYVVEMKNLTHYKLLMGQFGSVASAESFRNAIKRDHPDSFIVSYTSL